MHYWNVSPSSVAATNWPGVQMTDQGNGWWSYTIADATCANIVFNDNGQAQTSDLNRCGDGFYDNGWSNNGRGESQSDNLTATEHFDLELGQNYPNPAIGMTTVSFSVSNSNKVSIALYDLQGKNIGILFNKKVSSGKHQLVFDSNSFRNGIYFYVMKTSEGTLIRKKMIIGN